MPPPDEARDAFPVPEGREHQQDAERDLIIAAQGGDQRAIEELHGRIEPQLRTHARRKLSSWPRLSRHVDDQDVVQGTWVKLLFVLHRVKPDEGIKAYALRILESELTRVKRRFGSAKRKDYEVAPIDESESHESRIESSDEGPAALAEQREVHGAINRCIEMLEEPYRTTVASHLESCTDSQSAKRRGIAEVTVRVQRSRGLQKVRACLETHYPTLFEEEGRDE